MVILPKAPEMKVEPEMPLAAPEALSARAEPPNAKPPSVVPEPEKLKRTRLEKVDTFLPVVVL